jgi:hypothetical protein
MSPNAFLRYFRDQPVDHPGKHDVHLMVWYYEDWLKKFFFSLLQTLEVRLMSSTCASKLKIAFERL